MSSNCLIVPWRKENQRSLKTVAIKALGATDDFSPMR
jgi:hypothetical protein